MILNNCRLIPELSGGVETFCGSVEIQDGKILSVSAKAGDAAGFDCGGGTLIPGLIDAHTHVTILGGVGEGKEQDPQAVLVEALACASRFLDYGFTTIRDCGSIHRAGHYVREAVKRGIISGPRIISAGRQISTSADTPKSCISRASINFADGEADTRRAVREECVNLADFIKIYASGSAYLPTGVPKHPIMDYDEICGAVNAARSCGVYVAAHCHADSAIRSCIRAGVKTIEHATYLGSETLKLLMDTPDCALVPTFSAMYVSQTDPELKAFWEARLAPMLESCRANIRAAYEAGALMGFGTDSNALMTQYKLGIEFKMRRELVGMSPIDILMQATVINAAILGLSERIGQIKPGLVADFVLLERDPREDFSVLYSAPQHVWKSGKMIK